MWLALLLSVATAAPLRYVYKGASASVSASAGLKQMSFGLTSKQVREIDALSGVNFGDVFYRDGAGAPSPFFSGIIYPDVPPPVIDGDPEVTGQWWIKQLHVKEAWNLASGNGVVIADCDAGFHYEEPDLNANVLANLGYDLSNTDAPLVFNDGPFAYHGTAVATIMLGVLNGKGTNGIAYLAKLVPLQNFNYDDGDKLDKEEATAACVLRAIATKGVSILLIENQTAKGSSETFVGTRDAVRLALKAGLIVVSAAGNAGVKLTEEVLDNTGSIIVGAVLHDETPAIFSNYGSRITVGAYGEKLHTLYGPGGKFGEFGGTSGAAPQVAATVALMKEVRPMLLQDQARDILQSTRVITGGNLITGGRLDVFSAVQAARSAAVDVRAWMDAWLFRAELAAILAE